MNTLVNLVVAMYLPSKVFLSTSTNFQFNFLFLSFKLFDFYFAHFDIELTIVV